MTKGRAVPEPESPLTQHEGGAPNDTVSAPPFIAGVHARRAKIQQEYAQWLHDHPKRIAAFAEQEACQQAAFLSVIQELSTMIDAAEPPQEGL